ncbi:MAG: hypothetical protein OJF49_004077 [Ktedonobacterales bacterium]|nr:MAG: hypothetical protein OJF49_004077 [Ktedonobacterales bacterium]
MNMSYRAERVLPESPTLPVSVVMMATIVMWKGSFHSLGCYV